LLQSDASADQSKSQRSQKSQKSQQLFKSGDNAKSTNPKPPLATVREDLKMEIAKRRVTECDANNMVSPTSDLIPRGGAAQRMQTETSKEQHEKD